MQPVSIETTINTLKNQYQIFISAIRGEHALAIAGTDADSRRAQSRLADRTGAVLVEMIPTIMGNVAQGVSQVVAAALADAGNAHTLEALDVEQDVNELKQDMMGFLVDCMRVDARTACIATRNIGISRVFGIGAPQKELTFKQKDGAGKGVDSDRFVALEIRHYLVRLYADLYLISAQRAGHDRFEFWDAKGELRGEVVLSEQTYAQAREKLLHPNTTTFPRVAA